MQPDLMVAALDVVVLITAASPHHNFVVTALIEFRISQDRVSLDDGRQSASHGTFQLLKVELPSGHARQKGLGPASSLVVPSREVAQSWRLGPDSV